MLQDEGEGICLTLGWSSRSLVLFTKVPVKNYGFVYFEGPKKEKHAARTQAS